MPKRPVGVFSLGILIVVLAITASAFAANLLANIFEIVSLTMILFGAWIVVLGGIRVASPEQDSRGAFTTFSGGILMTTLGVVWTFYIRELFAEYLFSALLLVIGILVVAAGIKAWRK